MMGVGMMQLVVPGVLVLAVVVVGNTALGRAAVAGSMDKILEFVGRQDASAAEAATAGSAGRPVARELGAPAEALQQDGFGWERRSGVESSERGLRAWEGARRAVAEKTAVAADVGVGVVGIEKEPSPVG